MSVVCRVGAWLGGVFFGSWSSCFPGGGVVALRGSAMRSTIVVHIRSLMLSVLVCFLGIIVPGLVVSLLTSPKNGSLFRCFTVFGVLFVSFSVFGAFLTCGAPVFSLGYSGIYFAPPFTESSYNIVSRHFSSFLFPLY